MISRNEGSTTFSLSALEALQTWADDNLISEYEPPAPGENPYLEEVNIPAYDSSDPTHYLISDNNGWLEINNPAYQHFYVEPGDYYGAESGAPISHPSANGYIVVTASGTSDARRSISLHNGNDTHPCQLTAAECAQYRLYMEGASYWDIDRPTNVVGNTSTVFYFKWLSEANYNTINRAYFKNFGVVIHFHTRNHYNTVQHSRFEEMLLSAFQADLSAIQVQQGTDAEDYPGVGQDHHVYGTKIIENEFRNCKAGRLNRYTNQECDFRETVFDHNIAEFTSDYYCDENGNLTPDGDYYYGEAGFFGQKYGTDSIDPNHRLTWTNNIQMGARVASPGVPNISGGGVFILAYVGTPNVDYFYNVCIDGVRGLATGDRYDKEHGSMDITMKYNTIVDSHTNLGEASKAISMYDTYSSTIENNAVIRPKENYRSIQVSSCSGQTSVSYNDICVPGDTYIYWYDNNGDTTGQGTNTEWATEAEAGYTEDLVFTKDKLTANPVVVTVPTCMKPDSPWVNPDEAYKKWLRSK